MHLRTSSAALVATVLLVACSDTTPEITSPDVGPAFSHNGVPTGSARGHGVFDAGVDVRFDFWVVQTGPDYAARGHMRFSTKLGDLKIEFLGSANCLAVDPVNNRAWIGGVVTRNNSEHPAFTTEIHQKGKDIWFRTVDYGDGETQPDRTTFAGFEGAAGIITSAEYCEKQIWPGPPDDQPDARTGPVIKGGIEIR